MSIRNSTSVRGAVGDALSQPSRVVLAVSGGLDSMVLLDAAAATMPRSRLLVATFDHGTGSAATAARLHVQQRSAALGIECVDQTAATAASSEVALRDARWRFLRQVAGQCGGVVATAHTMDDQVETVLMRILRDSGARGLAGLYAHSDILRPLLHVARGALVRYARRHGVTWVEDPTNATPRYFRNRIRHDLLPALRRVNPYIDAELLTTARKAARWRERVEAFVERDLVVEQYAGGNGLDVNATALALRSPAELAVLWPAIAALTGVTLDRRGILRLAAFTAKDGARIGARIQLSGGWEVVRSRDAVQLRPLGNRDLGSAPLPSSADLERAATWGNWSFRAVTGAPAGDVWSAWLPTGSPLAVRTWRPGDTMSASAGGPRRKVKLFLSKAGITGHERTHWPVVLAGDQIVWIPGVRRSDRASPQSGESGLAFVCEHHLCRHTC